MLAAQVLNCLSVGLMCWESCANTLYVSTIIPHTSWLHRYLVCVSIGLKVLEVLEGECCLDNWVGVGTIIHPEMLASLCAIFPSDELAAQVLLVCLHIGWVEVLEVLCMLATQVLVCLPIGWVEVLEVLRMLDAQVLVCLSVRLKCRKFCWESCANTLYVSTIFPSENLAAQVLGVRIGWFEVLEVLEGSVV